MGGGTSERAISSLASPDCQICLGKGVSNGNKQCRCVTKMLDEMCAGIGSVATGLDNPQRKRKKVTRSIDETWEGG